MDFKEWITQEINKRGWSMREASIKAGLSDSMVGKVVGGYAPPGLVFYRGLAKALDIPLIEILIKAGEVDPADLTDESLNARFSRLSGFQQRMVLKFIESITQEEESEENTNAFTPPPKPRTAP
jgi:transcriptional regulator with XRE-family HTH domain